MPTAYTKKDGTVVRYNYYKKKEGPIKRPRTHATKTKINNRLKEIEDKEILDGIYAIIDKFLADSPK